MPHHAKTWHVVLGPGEGAVVNYPGGHSFEVGDIINLPEEDGLWRVVRIKTEPADALPASWSSAPTRAETDAPTHPAAPTGKCALGARRARMPAATSTRSPTWKANHALAFNASPLRGRSR